MRVRTRRGAYTVEFALCAIVFFMTIFFSIEVSRLMYVRQALDQTAYESARTGIVAGATNAEAYSRATDLLNAYGIAFASVVVEPAVFDDETREVTVTIQSDFSQNTWIPVTLLTDTVMTATVTLDHENQAFLVPEEATQDDALDENDEPLDV
jgi:Flp pilus assembly protein TadG